MREWKKETVKQVYEAGANYKLIPSQKIFKYQPQSQTILWTADDTNFYQTEYELTPRPNTIDYGEMQIIFPAENRSIVSQSYYHRYGLQFICYFSAQGKQLHNECRDYFKLVGMLTPQLALFTQQENKKDECIITQWNLKEPSKNISISCPKLFWDSLQTYRKFKSGIHIFGQTQLICCCWPEKNEKDFLKLAYFKYPLKSSEDTPYSVSRVKLPFGLKKLRFVKLNRCSMVAWFPIEGTQNQSIEVIICMLTQNGEQVIQEVHHVKTSLIQFKKQEKESVLISDIWEFYPGEIFLQLAVVVEKEGLQGNKQIKVIRQNDFIWNYKNKDGTPRKLQLGIQSEHKVQILGDLRKIYLISRLYSNYEFEAAPILYIDMLFEKKVMALQRPGQKDQVQQFRTLYQYLDYAPELQYCFTVTNPTYGRRQQKVTIRKIEWPKVHLGFVVSFFLTNLIDDCDEDLIQFAIKLSQHEKNQSV